ncbi:uncharacterized protein isoform X2 [Leptinotarsa decemlineata]|uniref:uncharacterized protein isoform X2 n=1 Tax=Leptinotarsa decemlineata TaxID=7539 RepID=UPI000C255496|nr:uncharacterized protein LOC111514529 isoform X2 [Leptinotarsa decemlineata]
MSSDESDALTVEEVNRALGEIENKFSLVTCKRNGLDENLAVLSMEYDSVGLPTLDLSLTKSKIFQQVVNNARSLVQIHRRTLSHMKDVNVDNRINNSKSSDLYKLLEDYKVKLGNYEEKIKALKNKLSSLTDEHTLLMKQETVLKSEMEKIKRYHISKQNELILHIKKMTKENQRLREIARADVGIYQSRDDVTLKLLGKYKCNEEIYKSTIQQLQENNKELLREVMDLREEMALARK